GILKNYQENIDYKVVYINNIKHYEILSEKLKKYLEEEWHRKINPDNYGGLSPLSEEMLKQHFVEGTDYSAEINNSGFKEIKIHSERLKKACQNWWDKKRGPRDYSDEIADAFLRMITNGKQQPPLTEAELKALNDPILGADKKGNGFMGFTGELRGEYIYNSKTGHFKSATSNMWAGGDDKHNYFSKYDNVNLTPETYQEARQAIFDRFLKKLRDNKQA
ncbi:9672_t:CDS:2, partial [Racocetra persica]